MRDTGRCEAANGGLCDRRVDEELVFGEGFGEKKVVFTTRWIEDSLSAGFQCGFELNPIVSFVSSA